MNKFFRISTGIILVLFVIWIIAAQSCNKMRTDDKTAIVNFKKTGIVLTAHIEKIIALLILTIQTKYIIL